MMDWLVEALGMWAWGLVPLGLVPYLFIAGAVSEICLDMGMADDARALWAVLWPVFLPMVIIMVASLAVYDLAYVAGHPIVTAGRAAGRWLARRLRK